jgi:nitrogen fixation NifU-like protein
MEDMYREIIIEHYKNPGYKGMLDPHDYTYEDSNPLCGDHIRIDINFDGKGRVKDARFSGHGCAVSQASADLLIESIHGKTMDELKQLGRQDVLDLIGIELGPVRLKCALLSLKVLKAGVYGMGVSDEEL